MYAIVKAAETRGGNCSELSGRDTCGRVPENFEKQQQPKDIAFATRLYRRYVIRRNF